MAENLPWRLESFLDSLIVELDRAQDTLALKGINRPLTYTVKDVSLELFAFPQYRREGILFATARPGESGASKVSIQLGSITDRQIKEVTKRPISKEDVAVELIPELDEVSRSALRKIGVTSVEDLKRMEEKNVDLEKASGQKLDYRNLASAINRARRGRQVPTVRGASLERGDPGYVLTLSGENLAVGGEEWEYPLAVLNERRVSVLSGSPQEVRIAVEPSDLRPGANALAVALDRYSVIRLTLQS